MEYYIAYSIVKNIKFYYQNDGSFIPDKTNAKQFSEEETGVYLCNKRLIRKTKIGMLNVELKIKKP